MEGVAELEEEARREQTDDSATTTQKAEKDAMRLVETQARTECSSASRRGTRIGRGGRGPGTHVMGWIRRSNLTGTDTSRLQGSGTNKLGPTPG